MSTKSPLEYYLKKHYEFRFNLLTEQNEFRKREVERGEFRILGKREQNSLCIELQDAGIKCCDHDVSRYLHSNFTEEYHPFRLYLEELPIWNGQDRLVDLAARVSSDPFWIRCFHRWMLATTAQWMGIDSTHANSTAPLLISEQQGWQKSTFCKSLMPKQLRLYYTDELSLDTTNNQEGKLALMGLINLDEFDRLSPKRMAQLKNLMQMSSLSVKKAHHQYYMQLPRIASFIGTSNRRDLLTDPTGSRRFICISVEKPIDCSGIEIDQIYAQLKAELLSGSKYWFTHEEEAEIQEHNVPFYQVSPEEELFREHFRAPQGTEEGEMVSLGDIIEALRGFHKGILRNLNLNRFGNAIVAAGIERIHTRLGNRYCVVKI